MSSIYDWSLVAGDNGNSDDAINWLEGQLPSTVNDSARAMMMRLAQFIRDNGVLTVGGNANAITITTGSPFTTPIHGMTLSFRAAATNTGAVTLAANGGGSKAIRKVLRGGSADVALDAGDINVKGIYIIKYDSTANSNAGAWILINPTLAFNYLPLTGGTLTGNLTLQIASGAPSLYIRGDGNRHVWFMDSDGTERGLIYLDGNSEALRFRVAGSKYFNWNADGSVDWGSAAFKVGSTSVTGSISATGTVSANGAVSAGDRFLTTGITAILGTGAAGTVYLRPNGGGSSVGQARVTNTGQLISQWRVYAGDGAAVFTEDGNLDGPVWSAWGTSNAFQAISARIENRASTYAGNAQAASMPRYQFSGQNFNWGATSSWQNTTGRIAWAFVQVTGPSGTGGATSFSASPDGGGFFNVVSAGQGQSAGAVISVPPNGVIRGSVNASGGNVNVWVFS